jgi:peptidoglycan/LPS O-acetylase OafA/YrhL
MSLTWKDGLATAFVGAAAVFYLLWVGGTTVSGLTGPRALTVAIFGLGIGGCYTAKSHMETVYGVGSRSRPPLYYVVLASVLGGVTLIAGIVALASGGDAALATLTGAMVALWALATFRHSRSRTTPELIRVRGSVAPGDRSGLPPHT